jgi:predicted heme/steroid binding protein
MSRRALAREDGSRGRTLVACHGLIYDVSASPEWREGLHRNLHWAGQDLTRELVNAPHGIETVARWPVVARLAEESREPGS